MTEAIEPYHLQWKRLRLNCRRGNAEVEHLLLAYCHQLNPENPAHRASMQTMEALLEENDQTLFEWLIQADSSGLDSAPEHFKPLIRSMRQSYLASTPGRSDVQG